MTRPISPTNRQFSPGLAWLLLSGMVVLEMGIGFSFPKANPAPLLENRFQVDINNASSAELAALPEIGPKIAQRIVEHRQLHGQFERVEQLLQVPGIGVTMFKQLQSSIRIGTSADDKRQAQSLVVR